MKNKIQKLVLTLLVAGLAFNANAQTGDPVNATATATATIVTPITLTKRFYPEFNGMTILKQKDVYGESFHKTTPIGGWLDSRIS